jgi:hypothetical protein
MPICYKKLVHISNIQYNWLIHNDKGNIMFANSTQSCGKKSANAALRALIAIVTLLATLSNTSAALRGEYREEPEAFMLLFLISAVGTAVLSVLVMGTDPVGRIIEGAERLLADVRGLPERPEDAATASPSAARTELVATISPEMSRTQIAAIAVAAVVASELYCLYSKGL